MKMDSTETKTIDLTPTWTAVVDMCLVMWEKGPAEVKQAAREELMRMAKHLDNKKEST
jgi:hypothetical protein